MYYVLSIFPIKRLREIRPIGSCSEARALKIFRLEATLSFTTDATTILSDFIYSIILAGTYNLILIRFRRILFSCLFSVVSLSNYSKFQFCVCRLKPHVLINWMDIPFKVITFSRLSPTVTMSSTCIHLLRISIVLWWISLKLWKFVSLVQSRIKGDCMSPKTNLVNLRTSTFFVSWFKIQWKQRNLQIQNSEKCSSYLCIAILFEIADSIRYSEINSVKTARFPCSHLMRLC